MQPIPCIAASVLSILLAVSAFAYSPIQPKHHKRYSPNSKFFVDFNPDTNHHTVYAADSPDDPLWSFDSDAFWPYEDNESDGCLFVADDGASIAGPTWVHRTGYPPDYRVFDGMEFWDRNGQIAAYRVSELPSWRLKILDSPVEIVWAAIRRPEGRGHNFARHGNELHVNTFGMRSINFSLRTGEITGWNLNVSYVACFALVYAVPVWFLARWIARRMRGSPLSRPTSRTRSIDK